MNKLIILLIIGIVFISGCSDNVNEYGYIEIPANETISINNGGVNLQINGSLEWYNSITIGSMVLCGRKSTPEECWEYKKDWYVGKILNRDGGCISINNKSNFCCYNYAKGVLINEGTKEEAIDFEKQYTRCYFQQRND